MPKMRLNKKKLKALLEAPNWRENIPLIAEGGTTSVGPLFSFLLLKPDFMHRAAAALGETVAAIEKTDPEAAKNVIRRFLWHMNEESGNIGWGIPDAFAECLVQSPALAKTYASILCSYVYDLGFDDNYCDNDILRRSCYWAIGRLARVRPELTEKSREWLRKGLRDRDSICRGMAAWALAGLPPDIMDVPALQTLVREENNDVCEIFENDEIRERTVSDLARLALARDKK